ncbi:ankyrin repeat domain-containing protein [bacterium]|jgi:ankyrin repeat protein|nr:ankyrin repeat domain-containing protein [bacterium]
MKSQLIAIVAAVLVVGCGPSEADRALLDAARDGNIKAVKQHLAAGADVNAKDERGKTPLDLTIQVKDPKTADLLRKHGGKTGEELEAEAK